jgi:hypothetical protein
MQAGASATGAIRELSEAFASGPFRIALALSVIVHVALLLGMRGGEVAPRSRPPVCAPSGRSGATARRLRQAGHSRPPTQRVGACRGQ